MEILFIGEDSNVFGKTSCFGLGRRQPEKIYGIKAQELREKANISQDDMARELKINKNQLVLIEKQEKGMTEKQMQYYMEKFGVEKEYFFDTDLETLILSDRGIVLKSFDSSKHCREAYNLLLEEFAKKKDDSLKNLDMFVDFRDIK